MNKCKVMKKKVINHDIFNMIKKKIVNSQNK